MLDEDNEGFGLDMYNIKIDDPQATNASTNVTRIDREVLRKQYKNQYCNKRGYLDTYCKMKFDLKL